MEQTWCERFWAKVDKSDVDTCWPWTASKGVNGRGKGQFGLNGKIVGAHRVAWEQANGPIPPDHDVRHVPMDSWDFTCCNPDHLALASSLALPRPPRPPQPTDEDRFWQQVDVGEDDACWPWTGHSLDGRGYGRFTFHGRQRKAHQVAWEMTHGPILRQPGDTSYHGTCALHHCDNPPCCNPSHLFLGSHRDNMDDMVRKGRHRLSRRTSINLAVGA
jgi:hypothetical protein